MYMLLCNVIFPPSAFLFTAEDPFQCHLEVFPTAPRFRGTQFLVSVVGWRTAAELNCQGIKTVGNRGSDQSDGERPSLGLKVCGINQGENQLPRKPEN